MSINIRGIRFEVPNGYGQVLKDMLEVLSEKFTWNIVNNEIYISGDTTNKSIFDNYKHIDAKTFAELINTPSYYVIFCNLQGSYAKQLKDVENYDEFIASECEIVVLIVDCSYTDIYVKSKEVLKILEDNAARKKYENIEYITDDNDRLKKFDY